MLHRCDHGNIYSIHLDAESVSREAQDVSNSIASELDNLNDNRTGSNSRIEVQAGN